jgi:Sulfotransferase family
MGRQLPAEFGDAWNGLLASGPCVIGCTGGSGSRVVASIVRRAGLFIGTELGPSLDARELKPFFTRWINTYWPYWSRVLPADLDDAMARDLRAALLAHWNGRDPNQTSWGWKAPRSMFLLPYFNERLPNLRLLHLVRDGRDMAFAGVRFALRTHAPTVLDPPQQRLPEPVRAIALWARINLSVARYGDGFLGDRYLRLRFEDLCGDPRANIARILEFFGLDGDADQLASAVTPPESVGRWRRHDPETVMELERVGRAALAEFGYAGSL